MRNPALFSRLFNTPLMILPTKLDAIVAGLASRWGMYDAHSGDGGTYLNSVLVPNMALTERGTREGFLYYQQDNVGVIPVIGVLAHRGGPQADSSYIYGYNQINQALNAALNDTRINSILLELDSPGGEVSGAFELQQSIKAANRQKPVHAVVSSTAASATYLIASAASSISLSETGIAGSIGVVLRHVDFSKAAEMEGVSVTYIYAGNHKIDGNPFQPLPESVKADLQTQIDKLYSMFVSTVAESRNLSTEQVRAQQARIYTGQEAIDAGLADRIATPDQILAELKANKTPKLRSITMLKPDNDAALEQQALDKARAEGFDAGKKEGQAEGVKAERARHAAVMAHETYAGREALANKMLATTGMTAEEITGLLAESPKTMPQAATSSQTPFEREMGKLGVTAVGAGAGDNDPDPDAEARAGWAKAAKPYQTIQGGRR